MTKCLFYECRNPVEPGSAKCVFHRNRSQCNAPHCRNQAYARGRCVRHGARKHCMMEGCTHYRRAGGYCARHTTMLRKSNAGLVPHDAPPSIKVEHANTVVVLHEPLAFVADVTPAPRLNPADWAFVQYLLHDDERETSFVDKLQFEWHDVGQEIKTEVDYTTGLCIAV
ncbi:Aste57867_1528 [Aphanomyces stellatus]|uniref:Aste57867_1528 protein n=1 Tax=Aphanomyces stellatus TaxID=120398 RepID=A0A485KAU8_9STRA|nr:hypothetical protein As57867_001527 [Aphanomyces stellatus]VFT78743.1 Aste57867_1528 [Aphanomyces stellatus]